MNDLALVDKIRKAMRNYFDNRNSNPMTVAYDWISLPWNVQEQFFELALAYIQQVAESDAPDRELSTTMRYYRKIAKDMVAGIRQ